jgi:hypothetical protein
MTREYKIGDLVVGYEPFRDGFNIYVGRHGERMNIHEISKDEFVARTRTAMLAKMIEDEIGDECRKVQTQAYAAGLEAQRGPGTCW